MKFYIASRFGLREKVRVIYQRIQQKGYQISSDWTTHKPVKPYSQNPEISKEYAVDDIQGVRDCDVFVLLSDQAGTGMYAELGAAILSNLEHGKPDIYVIGEYNDRSMFFFHPAVKRRETLDQVLDEVS